VIAALFAAINWWLVSERTGTKKWGRTK